MTPALTAALAGFFLYGSASAATLPATWADAARSDLFPTYHVAMTAYNAVPSQTDSTPTITASGVYTYPEVVAARSQDLADELPFGTVIAVLSASSSPKCGFDAVNGLIGLRVIADTMNARMHHKVDILFGTDTKVDMDGRRINAARALGICHTKIAVVGHIDMAHMPQTQLALESAVGLPALALNR